MMSKVSVSIAIAIVIASTGACARHIVEIVRPIAHQKIAPSEEIATWDDSLSKVRMVTVSI